MKDSLRERTAKGLFWGGMGNGMLQILNLVFGLFLARLLTPADYGVVGALTIFSAIAGLFCESGFTLAIVNRKDVDDECYNSVFWFSVAMAGSLYVILFFCAPLIAAFYHTEAMTSLSRVLFLSFTVGAVGTVPAAYMFRNMMVKERTRIQVLAMVVAGTVGVVCAAQGMGYWGIAIQTVAYSALNTLMMWVVCRWRPRFQFSMTPLREMLPFSLRQLITTLFGHINNNVFAVLLGRLYGMGVTGYYTQGSKWTTMGSSTLSGMINSVGQPVIRETRDDAERTQRVFRKLLRFTAMLSFPAMLGLGLVARELIEIAVTDKWLQSVGVMQILCVWGAFVPVNILYGNLMNAMGRADVYMWSTITVGLLQLAALIATSALGLTWMLVVYVVINILWLGVWQFYAKKEIGVGYVQVASDIAPYMMTSVVALVLAWLVASMVSNVWLSLIIKILVAAGTYLAMLWVADSKMLKESIDFVKAGGSSGG